MNSDLQTSLLKKRNRPLLNNYNVIPDEKRYHLIDMVLTKKMRVKDASQILNINYQTAKSILRRYNQKGVISRTYKLSTFGQQLDQEPMFQEQPSVTMSGITHQQQYQEVAAAEIFARQQIQNNQSLYNFYINPNQFSLVTPQGSIAQPFMNRNAHNQITSSLMFAPYSSTSVKCDQSASTSTTESLTQGRVLIAPPLGTKLSSSSLNQQQKAQSSMNSNDQSIKFEFQAYNQQILNSYVKRHQ